MRVIVTGGAGFIGSHLVDALLARGDEVHVLDSLVTGRSANVAGGATLRVLDVREPLEPLVLEVRPEAIFHLAAQADVRVSVERPTYDADVNVLGTVRVLEAARVAGAAVVFASTGGAIYGECERPARESDERRPLSPYGASKLAGEEYLATYGRLYGVRSAALRFGNVYGPRQDPHGEAGVVAIFFSRIRAGKQALIYGDGLQTRDYVYVGDVVGACVAALAAGAAGVFNVGTGSETSVVDLWQACLRAAGAEATAQHAAARLGELRRSALDNALAAKSFGWRPGTSLDDGLARTWEWQRIR